MLITIPATQIRNAPQSYSINTTDLAALVTPAYFKDQANWSVIVIEYRSLASNQIKRMYFTPSGAEVLTNEETFAKESRKRFALSQIIIYDFQKGRFPIDRASIPSASSFDLSFVDLISQSFYNMLGRSESVMMLNKSNSNELITVSNSAVYDSTVHFVAALEGINGDIHTRTSDLINNYKIQAYFVNADESKIYAVGRFGLSYNLSVLPAISIGANFNSTPPRLIVIDVATGVASLLADIENVNAGANIGSEIYSLVVDTSQNVAVLSGQNAIAGYNISTGLKLWQKNASFNAGATPRFQRQLKDESSSNVIILTISYDGVSFSQPQPIRLSKLTGTRDLSLPDVPTYSAACAGAFSISPDKSKLVISLQTAGKFAFFDGVAWSAELAFAGGSQFSPALYADNDSIVFLMSSSLFIRKTDYSGVAVPGFTAVFPDVYDQPSLGSQMQIVGSNIVISNFSNMYSYNFLTGARNTSYKGMLQYSALILPQVVNDHLYVNHSTTGYFYPMATASSASKSQSNSIARIDMSERELIDNRSLVNVSTSNPSLHAFSVSTLDDRIISLNSNLIRVMNLNTNELESGWPVINAGNIGGGTEIGEYLYVASSSNIGNFNFTDAIGLFTNTSPLIRINLLTKLIDRSFAPTFPNFGGNIFFSETDNYFYISCSEIGASQAYAYQIKKSDDSIIQITKSLIGLTPGAFGNFRLKFYQTASNVVAIVPDAASLVFNSLNSTYTLEDKPYFILNETTLAQTGVQTTVVTDAAAYLSFNSFNNELVGVIKIISTNELQFVTYDLDSNSRAINGNSLEADPEVTSGEFLNVGSMRVSIVSVNSDYYFFFTKVTNPGLAIALIDSGNPFIGIVKMSPFGAVDTDY